MNGDQQTTKTRPTTEERIRRKLGPHMAVLAALAAIAEQVRR